MSLEQNDHIEKDIETLKKERDLLLVKKEIQKLKRQESREKNFKKYFKVCLTIVIYAAAMYGLLLIVLSLSDKRSSVAMIITGLLMITPLFIIKIKQSSNKESELEKMKDLFK